MCVLVFICGYHNMVAVYHVRSCNILAISGTRIFTTYLIANSFIGGFCGWLKITKVSIFEIVDKGHQVRAQSTTWHEI